MGDVRPKTNTQAGGLEQPATLLAAALNQRTNRQAHGFPTAAAAEVTYRGSLSMINRKKVNVFSDYCHLCGEPPAVFCFTCDEKQSYFCNSCSGVIHSESSTLAHDVVRVAEVIEPKHVNHCCINTGHSGDHSSTMLSAKMINEKETREERFNMYKKLDDAAVIRNDAEFECIICFSPVAKGKGIILHSCLHSFCRDCLKKHIKSSEGAEIKCPFNGNDHFCEQMLEEREIREVAPKILAKLHERTLQTAEAEAANSFHCQTIDCKGWCFYEDGVNEFKCEVCGKQNCLSCKVQHPRMNCRQYQDDLQLRAPNDAEARKSLNTIKWLLESGEARHCPGCQVVILKNGGCDHMKCAVCDKDFSWDSVAPTKQDTKGCHIC